MGGQTALSLKEEEIFVHDLIVVSNCRSPFYKLDLCVLVKGYLEKTSREVNCFKNNTPGEEWLKRQSDSIGWRMCQNIKTFRAKNWKGDFINTLIIRKRY